MKTTLVEMG